VSPLTQTQLAFFANINLLDTFFAKDSLSKNQEGDANLSVQSENKITSVSVSTSIGANDGSKTVKE
jgi:hypothetical protein